MKAIVYGLKGGVGFDWPNYQAYGDMAEEIAWRILRKDATEPRWIDESEIPKLREFRDALVIKGGNLTYDMEKCRAIHRDRLRILRAPKLAALDVEYQRADERGDLVAKAAIAAEKQELRDVTSDPAIDAARTPEELKAVMPEPLR